MKIESTLYYRHVDLSILRKIDELLTQHYGYPKKFRQLAKRLHTSRGHLYAEGFMHDVFDVQFDLHPEKLIRLAGFSIVNFEHGRYSQHTLAALMIFLKQLIPDLHIQAWAYSLDDRQEFWLKFEAQQLKCIQDQPHVDLEHAQEILNSIYPWWHATMPVQIHEGILNQRQSVIS